MRAQWLVAKYIADEQRRETQNIGVCLIVGGQAYFRFKGQGEGGEIDGRRARFTKSVESYKSWVSYWSRLFGEGVGEDELRFALEYSPDATFFLEEGGEQIFGEVESPAAKLRELYGLLVESESTSESVDIHHLVEDTFDKLDLSEEVKKAYTLGDPDQDGDPVVLDYYYENGKPNLMQAVSLAQPGVAWKNAYAAAWIFEKAASLTRPGSQTIALIKPREDHGETYEEQFKLLTHKSNAVVDMSEDSAVERVGDLLGVK